MHLIVLAACIGALWLSHKFHDAYVHAVSREERSWFQRVGMDAPRAHRRHIGHRLFLGFDLLCVAVAVVSWSLARSGSEQGLLPLMRSCEEFGALILAWMFVEGRHLESFYQRLARATRGLGKSRRLAWRDPFAPPARKVVLWCALVWAALPGVFSLIGVNLTSETPLGNTVAFGAFFLLPLAVVAAVIIRALSPVRRLAYTRS